MKIRAAIIVFSGILLGAIMIEGATIEEVRSGKKWGKHPGAYRKNRDTAAIASYGATAAEQASFLAALDAIDAAIAKHPLMANPRGYNAYGTVRVSGPDGHWAPAKQTLRPVDGSYTLVVREFGDGPGGTMAEAKIGAGSASFRVNSFGALYDGMRIYSSGTGDDLYYRPRQLGTFLGHPVFNENSTVFFLRSSNRPLWVPVSADEFINIVIRRTEEERDRTMKELEGKNLSPKDIVNKEKAQRRTAFEKAYRTMKKYNPVEAEKARREYEEQEKKYAEEAAGRNETSDGLRAAQRRLYDDRIASLKSELASYSASRRKAQAIFTGESEDRPSGLGNAGDDDAKPIVRINPDYFNDGRPRGAIRCIVVQFNVHGTFNPGEKKWSIEESYLDDHALAEMHMTLDWKAILDLLAR